MTFLAQGKADGMAKIYNGSGQTNILTQNFENCH